MMKRIQAVLPALLFVSVLSLSGCASDPDKGKELATDKDAVGKEESLDTKQTAGILEGRTDGPMLPIYFEFDSSEITDNNITRIENNADFIKSQASVIRIEGNCDSRGTAEYNMALGERRALAAKKYLINLGVAEDKLTTVSFGEDRLIDEGADETSHKLNRRDDFRIIE